MKLLDSLLLALSVALLIIGIYEIFAGNFQQNYWIFMLMMICLFTFGYRKAQRPAESPDQPPNNTKPNKKKKRS
jgi:hypothetical protein